MIEINNSPLALLAACFFPLLFISLIIVPIFVTRSRLKELKRMRQIQEQRLNEELSTGEKLGLQSGILKVLGLSFSIGMFIVLLVAIYWIGKTVGFDNRTYLLGMVAPLICSIPGSALILFFIHKRMNKE